ncbi:MAG TPA: hypothetical protein VF316_10160 [Polyangiaceae bacterium]
MRLLGVQPAGHTVLAVSSELPGADSRATRAAAQDPRFGPPKGVGLAITLFGA